MSKGKVEMKAQLSTTEARRNMDKLQKNVKTNASKSKRSFDKVNSGVSSLTIGLGAAAAAAAALGATLVKAMQTPNISDMTGTLEDLMTTTGETADSLLKDLRSVTKGLLDESQLIQASLSGIGAGLSTDHVKALMEDAVAYSKIHGESVEVMYGKLTKLMTLGRTRYADELGVKLGKLTDIYKEHAASVGKTVEELTELEKRSALFEAYREKSRTVVNAVGTDMANISVNTEQIFTWVRNAWQAFGTFVQNTAETIAGKIVGISGKIVDGYHATFGEFFETSVLWTDQLKGLFNTWKKNTSAYLESVSDSIRKFKTLLFGEKKEDDKPTVFDKLYAAFENILAIQGKLMTLFSDLLALIATKTQNPEKYSVWWLVNGLVDTVGNLADAFAGATVGATEFVKAVLGTAVEAAEAAKLLEEQENLMAEYEENRKARQKEREAFIAMDNIGLRPETIRAEARAQEQYLEKMGSMVGYVSSRGIATPESLGHTFSTPDLVKPGTDIKRKPTRNKEGDQTKKPTDTEDTTDIPNEPVQLDDDFASISEEADELTWKEQQKVTPHIKGKDGLLQKAGVRRAQARMRKAQEEGPQDDDTAATPTGPTDEELEAARQRAAEYERIMNEMHSAIYAHGKTARELEIEEIRAKAEKARELADGNAKDLVAIKSWEEQQLAQVEMKYDTERVKREQELQDALDSLKDVGDEDSDNIGAELIKLDQEYAAKQEMLRVHYEEMFNLDNLSAQQRLEFERMQKEQSLALSADYYAREEALRTAHSDNITQKEKTNEEERAEAKANLLNMIETKGRQFLAEGARQSKKMFELKKAADTAETIVSTFKATQDAFSWGMKYGGATGPALAAAAAASALAAGMTRVKAIQATKYGDSSASDSGSAGSIPGSSSGTQANVSSLNTDAGKENKGEMKIVINGDVLADDEYILKLSTMLSDAVKERDVTLYASEAKYVAD